MRCHHDVFVYRVCSLFLVPIWTFEILFDFTLQIDVVWGIHFQFLIILWIHCFRIRKTLLFLSCFLQLGTIIRLPVRVDILGFMKTFVRKIVLLSEVYWHLISEHAVYWWATRRSLEETDGIAFTIWLVMKISRPVVYWALTKSFFQGRIPIQLTVHLELYVSRSNQESS